MRLTWVRNLLGLGSLLLLLISGLFWFVSVWKINQALRQIKKNCADSSIKIQWSEESTTGWPFHFERHLHQVDVSQTAWGFLRMPLLSLKVTYGTFFNGKIDVEVRGFLKAQTPDGEKRLLASGVNGAMQSHLSAPAFYLHLENLDFFSGEKRLLRLEKFFLHTKAGKKRRLAFGGNIEGRDRPMPASITLYWDDQFKKSESRRKLEIPSYRLSFLGGVFEGKASLSWSPQSFQMRAPEGYIDVGFANKRAVEVFWAQLSGIFLQKDPFLLYMIRKIPQSLAGLKNRLRFGLNQEGVLLKNIPGLAFTWKSMGL